MEKQNITEIKIQVPPNMCIDEENSTFECIKFKPIELIYDDIAKKLFYDNNPKTHYIDSAGNIQEQRCGVLSYGDRNRAISFKQCKRLLAINQLMNVAHYFNEIVDKAVIPPVKYVPEVDLFGEIAIKIYDYTLRNGIVWFKTKESLRQAIKILGEEIVKLAISL